MTIPLRIHGYRGVVLLVAGLLLSRQGSAQGWTGNGPYYKDIRAIVQSPGNPLILWAGAFGWGIFKSTDGGTTWINDRSGLTNAHVRSLVALSDSVVFAGTNDGVFLSTNGGNTWHSSHKTPFSVRALAYDPAGGTVYAGTYGSGLYRTTNQGTTWTSISVADPTSGQVLNHERTISVFGANSLYVGGSIGDIDSGGALFKSVDGGDHWVQVQTGTGVRSSVMSTAISPLAPANTLLFGTAANGVYRSTNAGATWVSIDAFTTPNPLRDQHIDAVGFTPGYYLAGTDSTGSLWYRTAGDTAVGWLKGTGTPGAPYPPNTILVDRTNSSVFCAGMKGAGVYRSADAGATWQGINAGILGTAARTIRINGDGTLILGTEFGDGIWLSGDGATTWTKAESLGTANSITCIATTSNSSTLYAGAYGTGVYRSTNGGTRWTLTDSLSINQFVRALCAYPTNPSVVYAGTGNGVYRTVNGGTSWSPVGVGMPANTSIRCLTMDRTNPAVIYCGTDSSWLFMTTNGGSVWTHATSANGFLPQDVFIRCVTIDRLTPSVVLAGSDSGRIYRSTSSGTAWTLLASLPTVNSVRSIVQSPNAPGLLFAATFGNGIFESADGGVQWQPLGVPGLPDGEIFALEADSANPLHLYAGTASHGVFRLTYTGSLTTVSAPMGGGWNLVSVPVSTGDMRKSILFPDAVSSAFAYDGTYTPRDTLAPGEGYWLKFASPDTVLFTGGPVSAETVSVAGGWNLVGSVTGIVSVAGVTAIPPAAILSPFYGFTSSGGYSEAAAILPGKAYWVKVSQAGHLVIGPQATR